MESKRLELKGMRIHFFKEFPMRKKPVIAVSFEGENAIYKVACFNSEETAQWFLECLEEALAWNRRKGCTEEDT